MKKLSKGLFLIIVASFLFTGCATTRQVEGAAAGATIGGLLGYAITGDSKGLKRGAAAGAAIGVYGNSRKHKESVVYSDGYSRSSLPENPGAQAAYEREQASINRQRQRFTECEARNQARRDNGLPSSKCWRPRGYSPVIYYGWR